MKPFQVEKIEHDSGKDEKEQESKSVSYEEDKEICEQESTDEIEKETVGTSLTTEECGRLRKQDPAAIILELVHY